MGWGVDQKRALIDPGDPGVSVRRQCGLLGLARSNVYYEPVAEPEEDLRLKRLIDEEYTRYPFYGVRRMHTWLREDCRAEVNHKRVQRLMREMGLAAIFPRPRLSVPGAAHKIYPYLLKGLSIHRPDQVWATDITYIRLVHGFVYLVAIMDWFSRYVLSWELSVTLDAGFCVEALDRALRTGKPDIFNTDQGSQFTGTEFTGRLLTAGIQISMDGRGRVFDNIFVERLWRTVKYENMFLNDYEGVPALRTGLGDYFWFYNHERRHQSLANRTPAAVYNQGLRRGA